MQWAGGVWGGPALNKKTRGEPVVVTFHLSEFLDFPFLVDLNMSLLRVAFVYPANTLTNEQAEELLAQAELKLKVMAGFK